MRIILYILILNKIASNIAGKPNILAKFAEESIIQTNQIMKKQLKMLTNCAVTPAIMLALMVLMILSSQHVMAQSAIGNVIRDKVREKAAEKTGEAVDDALNGDDNETNGDENTEAAEPVEENNSDAETEQPEKPQVVKQKVETRSQYDFVPGDKVLFFDDFSQDAVGDFPALWTTTGSGEIKTVNVAPGNWLHMTTTDQVYNLMKDLNLPENFIFEFDVIPQTAEENTQFNFYFSLYNSTGDYLDDQLYPGISGLHVTLSDYTWSVRGYHNENERMLDGESTLSPLSIDEVSHVIVWVQKARLRIYHKGQKVVDMPTVMYTPTNFNRLRFSLWSCTGLPLVSNIRFTTAAPDTRSKLLTEGKLVSYGIYFDVNSDKIKPESKGAVADIAKVLNENPTVRVRIDGHTDSDGEDTKNMDLSKRRAASVKNMLVSDFSVAADRIETGGYGESKPVADNSTPENKAKNRRVEFIKL